MVKISEMLVSNGTEDNLELIKRKPFSPHYSEGMPILKSMFNNQFVFF